MTQGRPFQGLQPAAGGQAKAPDEADVTRRLRRLRTALGDDATPAGTRRSGFLSLEVPGAQAPAPT